MYQALERTKTSRTWTHCWRVSSLRVLQDWRVLSIPKRTLYQESWTVLEKTGEMVNPRAFTEVEARIHWRGQSWRPAQEPRPMMVVCLGGLQRQPRSLCWPDPPL
jgi:hypothetical protein